MNLRRRRSDYQQFTEFERGIYNRERMLVEAKKNAFQMSNDVTLIAGVTSRISNENLQACLHCVMQVPNVTLWYTVSSMLIVLVVSILVQSLLVVDDAGVVGQ
ncbi:hypothetical protein TNCV_4691221 [Trichonephila clavipes]|nr:hypothetical protein TNCV_4691221 [Trichonephila clavipes]